MAAAAPSKTRKNSLFLVLRGAKPGCGLGSSRVFRKPKTSPTIPTVVLTCWTIKVFKTGTPIIIVLSLRNGTARAISPPVCVKESQKKWLSVPTKTDTTKTAQDLNPTTLNDVVAKPESALSKGLGRLIMKLYLKSQWNAKAKAIPAGRQNITSPVQLCPSPLETVVN